jgi:LacI family transcriptional regulator
LLVANNLMTLGALQCIHEHQISIPKDIALVGFDDMPWVTSLQPPLTVIAQPTFEMGRIAARLLLDRIENPENPIQRVNLGTQLIIRQSCGFPLGGKASITIDTPMRFH